MQHHPLPEYPRPALRRDSYENLNGLWQYAITGSAGLPAKWDGDILVPYSPETKASGVGRTLQPGAAYVDLFDDVGLRSAACYGLLERIEVNDNEVDFRDGVFCHLLAVAFVVAASEDATEDAWVQSLNTSAED